MHPNDLSSIDGDRTTVSNPQPKSEYWCVTYSDVSRQAAAYERMAAAGTAAAAVSSIDHVLYLHFRDDLNEAAIDDLFPYATKRWHIDQAHFDSMVRAHTGKGWQATADPTPLESTADPQLSSYWRIFFGAFKAQNEAYESLTTGNEAILVNEVGQATFVQFRNPLAAEDVQRLCPAATSFETRTAAAFDEAIAKFTMKLWRRDDDADPTPSTESQPRPAAGGAPVESQQQVTSLDPVPTDLDDDQDDPATYFGSDSIPDDPPPAWQDDDLPSDRDAPPADDLAEDAPTPSTKTFHTIPQRVMESLRQRAEKEAAQKKQATRSIVSRQNNSLDPVKESPTPQQRPPKKQDTVAAPAPKKQDAGTASSQAAMEKKRLSHVNAKSRARTRRDNGGMDLYPAGSINQGGVKAFQFPSIDDLANIIRDGKGGGVPDFSKVAARAIQAYIPVLNAKNAKERKAAKDAYDKVKAGLPYVVCSSVAWQGQRKAAGGYFHTGYTVHDLDGLTADQVETVFTDLMAIPEVWLVSRSASRHGLWCLVAHEKRPVDSNDKPKGNPTHKDAWQAADDLVYEATGVKPDKNTKDNRRVRYIAHDPKVFIRDKAERVRFAMPYSIDELPAVDQAAAAANQAAFATMDDGATAAGDADPTPSTDSQPKRYVGKSKAEWNLYKIQDAMSKHSPVGWSYEHWLAVGFGLRRAEARGELPAGTGLRLWDDWSATDPDRYQAGDCERKWAGFGIDGKGIGTVFYLFQQVGWTTPDRRKVSKKGKKGGDPETYQAAGMTIERVETTGAVVQQQQGDDDRELVPQAPEGLRRVFYGLGFYPVRNESDLAKKFYTDDDKPITWAAVKAGKVKEQPEEMISYIAHHQGDYYCFVNDKGERRPASFPRTSIQDCNNARLLKRRFNPPILYLESLPAADADADPPAILPVIFNVGDDPMAIPMAEYLDKLHGLGFCLKAFHPKELIDRHALLIGATGAGKSTYCKYLMPLEKDWHTNDLKPSLTPKEVIEVAGGHHIAEHDEIGKSRKTNVDIVKAFFSKGKDTARGAYGEQARSVYQHFLQVLTTNESSSGLFPFDESEAMARRFGVLPVSTAMDGADIVAYLRETRDAYFGYWYSVYKFLKETGGVAAVIESMRMPRALEEWNRAQYDRVQETDDIAQELADAIFAAYTGDDPPDPAPIANWLYGLGYVKDPSQQVSEKEKRAKNFKPSQKPSGRPAPIPEPVKPELTTPAYKRFATEVGKRLRARGGYNKVGKYEGRAQRLWRA